MRTCHTTWLLALSAAVIAACSGDDGGSNVDARPIDAPSCTPVNDNNECTTDECVAGQPVNTPRDGASCTGGGTCNASGTCVPAPSCTDNMMNGTETGVDCGGSCAPARTCDTGAGCTVAGDCTSGVCSGTPMTCQAASCGDGVMQAGEMCDDGNNVNGDGCDDGAGDACRPTGCGNGVTTGTEACDDGNAMNGDGCDNNCTVTGCGNGVTTGTETCDDGDTMDGDGCSAACAPETGYTCTAAVPSVCTGTCGDGILAVGAETCDQGMGNQTPGDGCSAACQEEMGWDCTGTPSVCATVCGDGTLTAPETCDDMNTANLDGCSATCRTEQTEVEPNEDGTPSTGGTGITGNDFDVGGMLAINNATAQGAILASGGSVNKLGTFSPAGDEDVWVFTNDTSGTVEAAFDIWRRGAGGGIGVACGTTLDTGMNVRNAAGTVLVSNDDRNGSADRCSALSTLVAPGTTIYVHVTVYDDNDTTLPTYGLQVGVFPVTCGDNRQVPGFEECDDGNTAANDGCSATCTVEGVGEVEPNEDGTPATGGSGITGNDFNAASAATVVANATAQGVFDVSTGGRTWLGSLMVGAAPGTAGDEDAFAVTNNGTAAFTVTAETRNLSLGIARQCTGANSDTGMNVRDAAGAVITSADDSTGLGTCSRVSFMLLPGQTRYLHVVEYGDDATIAKYALVVTRVPVVCGDATQTALAEECDDGNTMGGDGCSATCQVEGTAETEPNEDGTPATGGTGIAGNDFDVGGMLAINNATAQGVLSVNGTNGRTWIAALRVGAAPGTAGDEDVYAVTNPGAAALEVQADTWDAATGISRACPTATADTGINVRDAAGVVVTSNDNRVSGDGCSRVTFILAAGQTRYIHVTENGDNAVLAKYFLVVVSRPVVCGDGVVTAGAETCDDGNTANSDGCSMSCAVEANFYCGGAPSVCRPQPTVVPLACTDMSTGTTTLLATGDDTVAATTALPFALTYYGAPMTHFAASTNGFVALLPSATATGPGANSFNSTTMPSTSTPNGILAPFWDDLVLTGAGLIYKTTGTAPNQVLTIEWNANTFGTPSATGLRFQAQIGQGGFVEYHYCAAAGDAGRASGSSATIGAENSTGALGFARGINTASTVTPGTTGLRWDVH